MRFGSSVRAFQVDANREGGRYSVYVSFVSLAISPAHVDGMRLRSMTEVKRGFGDREGGELAY